MATPRVILRALYDASALPVDVAMRFNLERMQRPAILSQDALREEDTRKDKGHASSDVP